MGKSKGKSAATTLSEDEMGALEQKIKKERTSKKALIRECILTLADYTPQERLVLKHKKAQVKALLRTGLIKQDDIEALKRTLEKSRQANKGFLKEVDTVRRTLNAKNSEVEKLKRKLDNLSKRHGELEKKFKPNIKNFEGWTIQKSKQGEFRLFKSINAKMHGIYIGRVWDEDKARVKIQWKLKQLEEQGPVSTKKAKPKLKLKPTPKPGSKPKTPTPARPVPVKVPNLIKLAKEIEPVSNVPVSIADLRNRAGMKKKEFDLEVLRLVKKEKAFVQNHAHPIQMTDAQRKAAVTDGKSFYIGFVVNPDLDPKAVRPVPDFSLKAFANEVLRIAQRPTAGNSSGKAYISYVWKRFQAGNMSKGEFKQQLVKAHQAGLLKLKKVGLPERHKAEDIEESETRYLNARFHFVVSI